MALRLGTDGGMELDLYLFEIGWTFCPARESPQGGMALARHREPPVLGCIPRPLCLKSARE